MSAPITPEQRIRYIGDPNHCPFCSAEEISAGEFDGETHSQRVGCLKCEREWSDIYALVDVEAVE